MKKFFLVSAIALFGLGSAQNAKFGMNGGLLTGFAKGKTPDFTTSDSSVGFYVGFFGEFNAGEKVKIQPAVNYANIDDASALQIPVMVKYYVDPKFNLNFGPQILFDLSGTPEEMKSYYNNVNFAIAIGAGYDISSKIFAEARYSFQVNNHLKNAPSGYSVRANYLNVGIGYKFN